MIHSQSATQINSNLIDKKHNFKRDTETNQNSKENIKPPNTPNTRTERKSQEKTPRDYKHEICVEDRQ